MSDRSKPPGISRRVEWVESRPSTQVVTNHGRSSPRGAGDPLDGTEDVPEVPVSPPLRRMLIGFDLLVVLAGWTVALLAAISTGEVRFGPLTAIAQTVLILGSGGLLLSASGLYRRRICAVRTVEVARIARVSLALATVAVVALAQVGREEAVLAAVLGGLSWFLLLSVERGVFREWINGRRASGDFGAPVLVVGGVSASTLDTAHFLADNPFLGFRVCGIVSPASDQPVGTPFAWFSVSGDVLEQARQCGASGVVLDSGSLGSDELNLIVQSLASTGLHVHISTGLRGVDVRRIRVAPLADETFLHIAPLGLSRGQLVTKRALDVVGATSALILLAPVLVVGALTVWVQDRGPVLFRQRRVGQNGERFALFKLRTMVPDAERLKAQLEASNERTGPLFKLGHDPRVTRAGRFLRASSIDEIPQLFNVLEGTMSLVGPRPALPDEVAQFDHQLNVRLTVKPGVTGLWQVEARDLANFDLYRRYDLLYVQNWSLGLDLTVLARTVVVVALRGARAMLPARLRPQAVVAGTELAPADPVE